ncbi:hypothetical protein CAter282_3030 [Collimonas arenae]|uniref:DUF2863 family protein n=1 Tax=Collimonas arenae TaxID=279058 RepID=A0A127PST7_9BURK|nr:DUF2863 family protein [Collimonas arenae]AMP00853.1 hypothetical protein CAter10_3336 [Collimonas arenae]AMP10745.1 hypothetical protein CAter282_3030 [Collimonas arenae]
MPKNKRPVPRKASESNKSNEWADDKDEIQTQALCDLAIVLAEQDDSEDAAEIEARRQSHADLHKVIRKSLQQKKDEILYDAIERTRYADSDAFQFLKTTIEEASEVLLVRRDNGKALELNVFVIPLFARVAGGLKREQCFQDDEAFAALSASIKEAQLESPDASVVLVSHAYHMDEIDSIRYSDLFEMNRDAFAAMADKKLAPATAIERSFGTWPDNQFAADDEALELRFLLGFALKSADDPFYLVPADEAAADAYFAARQERFQQWAERVAPLVQRCLVTDGSEIAIHFLYQDLFHGGKERGMAEYFMLLMMSELNHGLEQKGCAPYDARAVVGPADVRGEMLLRVSLYGHDGVLLVSAEKPLGATGDLQAEIDDVYDALTTIGITSLAVAMKFDADGQPLDVQAYPV